MRPEVRTEPSATVVDLAADRETGGADLAGLGCVLDAVPIDGRHEHGTIVVVRMVGEIDLATQAGMETALYGGLQAEPRHMLVDLSGVRFCGARGFAQLAETARCAAEHQIEFALTGLAPHLRRVATTLWGSDGPARYRSLAVAVTTIRAGRAQRERAHEARADFGWM